MKRDTFNLSTEPNQLNKVSVKEAMQRLGVGEDLFWKLAKEGKIRIRQLSAKKRFLFLDELEEDMRNLPSLKK